MDAYDAVTAFDLSTTRRNRPKCWRTSTGHCVPAGPSSWVTSRRRVGSRTTSVCRWPRTCTRVSTMHCMTVSLALDGVGLGTDAGVACDRLEGPPRPGSLPSRSARSNRTSSTTTTSPRSRTAKRAACRVRVATGVQTGTITTQVPARLDRGVARAGRQTIRHRVATPPVRRGVQQEGLGRSRQAGPADRVTAASPVGLIPRF